MAEMFPCKMPAKSCPSKSRIVARRVPETGTPMPAHASGLLSSKASIRSELQAVRWARMLRRSWENSW
eukprot:3789085-Amphidinium_carterae.1